MKYNLVTHRHTISLNSFFFLFQWTHKEKNIKKGGKEFRVDSNDYLLTETIKQILQSENKCNRGKGGQASKQAIATYGDR